MLLLCSDGLTSPALLNCARENLPRGARRAALVVTADYKYKENDVHTARCRRELEQLGLGVTLFDFDAAPAQELLAFDVVELMGGNPFYLLKSIREHQAYAVLAEIAGEKLLIGWSAGALVLGPGLELINRYTPGMNLWAVDDLRGLRLTDAYILPHYKKYLNRFERFEETCADFEREKNVRVLRISDGEGLLAGKTLSFIGG